MSLIIPGLGYTTTVSPPGGYIPIPVDSTTPVAVGSSDPRSFEEIIDDAWIENEQDREYEQQIVQWNATPTKVLDINKIGSNIPIDQMPTEDTPFQIRYPQVLPSEGYLNVEAGTVDRITFPVPKQFYRVAIPEIQFGETQKSYKRDVAQFISVVTNNPDDETEWYAILLSSPMWDRFKVNSLLDLEFTELSNA